jgi:muramoyltetrapeptide carboxypeptidase
MIKLIQPPPLHGGDEIRIIAPSHSLSSLDPQVVKQGIEQLKTMGFVVTVGEHAAESVDQDSAAIEARIADLHAAFQDKSVTAIICADGGFNANQLLRYIDWNIIRSNPKIFCGYSDITVLNNAILAKTGLITYSGPMLCTFGESFGLTETIQSFRHMVMENTPETIWSSSRWNDDDWNNEAERQQGFDNTGLWILSEGACEATIAGGNLSSFKLLQGTEYFPDIDNYLLCLEDDYEYQIYHFDRDLQSLIHAPWFQRVRGLIIGRFESASQVTQMQLRSMIHAKPELTAIPVIGNVDFGHTNPKITLPIGGKMKLSAHHGQIEIINNITL